MKLGRLIGVGVGPGDPELITLKAARIIRTAPVVAYPVANGTHSRARDIAATLIGVDSKEIGYALPMTRDRQPAQDAYDAAAQELRQQLNAGLNVAVLCEGDPLFFGSFMYLAARLSNEYVVQVVPGITSVTAASAALCLPVAARNQTVAVVPGGADPAQLAAVLRAHDTVAILKVGRHLECVRSVVGEEGLSDQAYYVANASMSDQVASPLSRAPLEAPYFSMILVCKGSDPWLT